MTTMCPLRYAFARLLLWRMQDSKEVDPSLGALGATTIALTLNIFTGVSLIDSFWNLGWKLDPPVGKTLFWSTVFLGALGLIQFRLWIVGGRWKQIAEEVRSETPLKHRVGGALVIVYLALSATGPIVAGLVAHAYGHRQTAAARTSGIKGASSRRADFRVSTKRTLTQDRSGSNPDRSISG